MRRLALASFVILAGCGEDQLVARGAPPATPTPTPATSAHIVPTGGERAPEPERALLLTVSKSGAMTIDGAPVADDAAIASRVQAALAATPDARVVVAAEREAPYTRVTSAIDAARRAGAKRVSLSQFAGTFGGEGPVSTWAGPSTAGNAATPTPPTPPTPPSKPEPKPAPVTVTVPSTTPSKSLGTPAEVGPDGWECVFPTDVDRSRIEATVITMRVLVDEHGKAVDYEISSDAPRPFADAAKACAERRRGWVPAKDPNGKIVKGWTFPFKVQFAR